MTIAALFFAVTTALAAAQLDVITTQPDLADVARSIGGRHVEVKSLTDGREDLHLVRIRPSLLVAARRADVFVQLGLDAEHSWVPALLRTAKNRKIRPGGSGFINTSAGVKALEVPERTDRGSAVDVHPRGNPHFNLDPEGMRIAARNVRDGLVRLLPKHREELVENAARWEQRLDEKMKEWRRRLAFAEGQWIVEDHDAWIYFAKRFGLRIAARLEPKPGLAPTPRHVSAVVETVKQRECKLIVCRARTRKLARKIARETDASVIVLPLSSTTKGPTAGYFAFMDHVVDSFAEGLGEP